jgi:hypothetical protein
MKCSFTPKLDCPHVDTASMLKTVECKYCAHNRPINPEIKSGPANIKHLIGKTIITADFSRLRDKIILTMSGGKVYEIEANSKLSIIRSK